MLVYFELARPLHLLCIRVNIYWRAAALRVWCAGDARAVVIVALASQSSVITVVITVRIARNWFRPSSSSRVSGEIIAHPHRADMLRGAQAHHTCRACDLCHVDTNAAPQFMTISSVEPLHYCAKNKSIAIPAAAAASASHAMALRCWRPEHP